MKAVPWLWSFSRRSCPRLAIHTMPSSTLPLGKHMTYHGVTHDNPGCDTRRPLMRYLAVPDEPVTSQVHSGRFDCEQSNAIIILFIQLGRETIALCSRRTMVFLSSQWQYIMARSIRFLFSRTHGYPTTYQCIKSSAVASLMTSYELCMYATPQW